MNLRQIAAPEALHIIHNGIVQPGADQSWYTTTWQQRAGCGPTNAAHLLWYLAKTRAGFRGLCAYDGSTKDGFLNLMEDVWQFVTPGQMGVNSTGKFVDGIKEYGRGKGIELYTDFLDIPLHTDKRPTYSAVRSFLEKAFSQDLPVAFLNLSNGALNNLDNWHWVTLVGMQGSMAVMYDQGRSTTIDLELWLRTTLLGGGFVTCQGNNNRP